MQHTDNLSTIRTPDQGEAIAVLVKAFQVLDALAGDKPESISQLANDLELPRTTVHRILQTLTAQEVLTPSLQPGPKLIYWALAALSVGGIRAASGPVLHRLVEAFGETASIFVRSGSTRTCIARLEGTEPIRHNLSVGMSIPLHVGSGGRVLLAWTADDERERLIIDSRTASKVPVVPPQEGWQAIREQGWAITLGERDPVLASISVPIFESNGRVAAALSLSGPRMRFSNGRVMEMAARLKTEAKILEGQIEGDA